jgi:DNA-binding PadR family transcriptional regulator
MTQRVSLGELEHQVLIAILRLGGEAYSVSITQELEERTGREASQAAIFIVLKRLEKKDLLESRLDDGAVPETGRVRRYFKLTPQGTRSLKETREALDRLWDGLDTAYEKGGGI